DVWQIAEPWNAFRVAGERQLHQARDGQRLALLKFNDHVSISSIQSRNLHTARLGPQAEVDRADFGINGQPDRVTIQDVRHEGELHAEFLVLNGDRGRSI